MIVNLVSGEANANAKANANTVSLLRWRRETSWIRVHHVEIGPERSVNALRSERKGQPVWPLGAAQHFLLLDDSSAGRPPLTQKVKTGHFIRNTLPAERANNFSPSRTASVPQRIRTAPEVLVQTPRTASNIHDQNLKLNFIHYSGALPAQLHFIFKKQKMILFVCKFLKLRLKLSVLSPDSSRKQRKSSNRFLLLMNFTAAFSFEFNISFNELQK